MDDLIRRQEVLNLLIRCAVPENGGGLLYQSIKQLPSAERHGRWHKIDKDGKGCASLFGCSVCKSATQLAWYEKDMFYKYCPYCGSRMDLGEEK